MDVLHIMWQGSVGGAERAVYQLILSQLKYSQYRPTVAYARSDGHYAMKCREAGCRVIDLGIKRARHLWAVPRLRRILKNYPVHHFHAAEVPMMLASLMCPGTVRVYTHRGGEQGYSRPKEMLCRTIGYALRNRFHGLTGNTLHACKIGASLFRIPEQRWDVTYNGLDFSLFEPERPIAEVATAHGIRAGDAVVIGTSANLRDWKRIDLLLRACARLNSPNYQILIIGDGPDRSRLQSVCRNLGLQNKTLFVGLQKNIGDFLQLVDVFVLPSDAAESFGNSVVEAMAQGIPGIVMSDGGGLPEHVLSGQTGFVVNSQSELTEVIDRLIADSALRTTLGTQARTHTKSRYTLQKMVDAYDSVYRRALVQRQNGIPH